jgi:hypothetical protein
MDASIIAKHLFVPAFDQAFRETNTEQKLKAFLAGGTEVL